MELSKACTPFSLQKQLCELPNRRTVKWRLRYMTTDEHIEQIKAGPMVYEQGTRVRTSPRVCPTLTNKKALLSSKDRKAEGEAFATLMKWGPSIKWDSHK